MSSVICKISVMFLQKIYEKAVHNISKILHIYTLSHTKYYRNVNGMMRVQSIVKLMGYDERKRQESLWLSSTAWQEANKERGNIL